MSILGRLPVEIAENCEGFVASTKRKFFSFRSLRKRLDRETLLVVYPDAHHGIRRPSYQKHLLERFPGWFDKYVKGSQSGS
jgi:hypothetical protein